MENLQNYYEEQLMQYHTSQKFINVTWVRVTPGERFCPSGEWSLDFGIYD